MSTRERCSIPSCSSAGTECRSRPRPTASSWSARGCDVDAYGELVQHYRDQALATAYLVLGDREEAQDAAQEAFTKGYLALDRFHPFRAWLLRIVVNEAGDLGAARQRRADLVARASGQVQAIRPAESAEAAALSQRRREALLESLFVLPEADRLVVTCRYFLTYPRRRSPRSSAWRAGPSSPACRARWHASVRSCGRWGHWCSSDLGSSGHSRRWDTPRCAHLRSAQAAPRRLVSRHRTCDGGRGRLARLPLTESAAPAAESDAALRCRCGRRHGPPSRATRRARGYACSWNRVAPIPGPASSSGDGAARRSMTVTVCLPGVRRA